MSEQIIIVGAGAAGLLAGLRLAEKNKNVIILEARDRIGGRMNTVRKDFSRSVEEGAEFIHGKLPISLSLLKEAQCHHYKMEGRIWRYFDHELTHEQSFIDEDGLLSRKLRELRSDMTVKQFLEINFEKEKHEQLIVSVRKFVEGYDSADYNRASALALKEEWLKEDDDQQYHIAEGYEKIYNYLLHQFEKAGGKVLLNSIVNEIIWSEKGCTVNTGKRSFEAGKALVTVPTGVLADKSGKGYIRFDPHIPELDNWIEKSGYGAIIKVIIEFTIPFWQYGEFRKKDVRQTDDLMFLFTDMKIPTWWTQMPDKYPLLTGWLSGPDAFRMKDSADGEILDLALNSLSEVYKITKTDLQKIIKAWHIKNWTADPFTKGAYSYTTPETASALEKMNKPFGKLYFAGEALSSTDNGTVEAAFLSAVKTVEAMDNE